MSISSEITRITGLKTKIKTALIAWGLVQSSAKLEDCANAIDAVDVHKAISAQISEGNTYTIPRGYHDGSGTVTGVGGGGNYSLQSKTVSPGTSEQTVTPDTGYYGLDSVTVGAIPSTYKDVSGTTATAPFVLSGLAFVAADGSSKVGSMTNVGKATGTINGMTTTSYTIAKGYHDGTGTVTLSGDIETALAGI